MPADHRPEPSTQKPNSERTILIVDDEPTLRMGFRLALTTENYKIKLAQDGEDALKVIEEADIDLMILDLRMPGIDGVGVLSRLATGNRVVPTVVASAHMDDSVVSDALRYGAVDFLNKPVRPNDLREIAKLVLNEEQEFSTETPTPDQAVSRARCLLRRRQPEAALTTMESAPQDLPTRSLWEHVARTLTPKEDVAAPAREVSLLTELVRWRKQATR